MTPLNDSALRYFAKFWKLDGDLMTCRACGRSLIASKDGEELKHRSGCQNEHKIHPWGYLLEAMRQK